MEFHEKLQQLRKQRGWTQEQLAEQLFVSRTAVSKWESGLSIPDLNRIIGMSSLFGENIFVKIWYFSERCAIMSL